jgi:hypothetical protein
VEGGRGFRVGGGAGRLLKGFLDELKRSQAGLRGESDAVVWVKNKVAGYHTARLGYRLMQELLNLAASTVILQ